MHKDHKKQEITHVRMHAARRLQKIGNSGRQRSQNLCYLEMI